MLVEICLEKRIIDLGNDWDVENEYVEVELDFDDVARVMANYYNIDEDTACHILLDLDIDDSQIRTLFEDELEEYAERKYYDELQDE